MVDTLDQDLELDGDEDKGAEEKGAEEEKEGTEEEKNEEETEKPTLTQVGLKESIKNAGAKTEDNQNDDDDDEVNTEDPSEDVNDAEEGDKPDDANDSTATKLAGAKLEEEAVEEPLPRKDYSLLDQVTSCLYEEEELLPILCGYFLKVMEQLLDKQKQMTLEYLLLHQEGRIFNGLLRHIDQHSLATLMIKLIEQ